MPFIFADRMINKIEQLVWEDIDLVKRTEKYDIHIEFDKILSVVHKLPWGDITAKSIAYLILSKEVQTGLYLSLIVIFVSIINVILIVSLIGFVSTGLMYIILSIL